MLYQKKKFVSNRALQILILDQPERKAKTYDSSRDAGKVDRAGARRVAGALGVGNGLSEGHDGAAGGPGRGRALGTDGEGRSAGDDGKEGSEAHAGGLRSVWGLKEKKQSENL